MTDLCWLCQKNNTLIYRSANQSEEEKSKRLLEQEEHLRVVHLGRSLYNSMVTDAKRACASNNITDLGPAPPCSRPMTQHYSFDFAQQVHLPSNPLQPGPLYFLVPRKVGIFGVCCEGLPKQVNFLIDEAHTISKGSNAVLSYLQYFFEHYGLGETDVNLHCDNCSGQNKNRYVLWYCAWRVAVGLHKSITLNFLITGHTKFAPDWCFGLLKQAFRRHAVSSITELESVVNESAVCNQAQVVGRENGTANVPYGDWQAHLRPFFRPLPGIKKFHQFRFEADSPGKVSIREAPDSPARKVDLFAAGVCQTQLPRTPPTRINPPGLDLQRQLYLFSKIREFVADEWKDVVCPPPAQAPTRAGT